jgi:iron complex transport system substrate-binding protein
MGYGLVSCGAPKTEIQEKTTGKIVSLNGSITEIIAALGFLNQLVGVDVTSNYPDSVNMLPKMGHNRNINIEAIIAADPDYVYCYSDGIKPEIQSQLQAAGIEIKTFDEPKDLGGVHKLIQGVAAALGATDKSAILQKILEADVAQLKALSDTPRVLFIYARGAGTINVGGAGTGVDAMITMAGGKNAAADISGFKPYTAEAAVKANPDVILLFDSGVESLGGIDAVLALPGLQQTNAGKLRRIYAMEGQLLSGFTPRTGKALLQLQNIFTQAQ